MRSQTSSGLPSRSPVKSPSSDHPILAAPPNLAHARERWLHPPSELEFFVSIEDFNLIWPYVDNFWVREQSNHTLKDGTEREYFECRQSFKVRKSQADPSKKPKQKSQSDGRDCKAKLYLDRVYEARDASMGSGQVCNDEEEEVTRSTRILIGYNVSRGGRQKSAHQGCSVKEMDDYRLNTALLACAGHHCNTGLSASVVWRQLQSGGDGMEGGRQVFLEAGGASMSYQDVANSRAAWRTAYKDGRLGGASILWHHQQRDANAWLESKNFRHEDATATRLDGHKSFAIVWGHPSLLQLLADRGAITMMDSTHKTNHCGWFLFTLVVRDQSKMSRPCAHFLTASEDGDIVAACLQIIRRWCGWKPLYFLTDDSAAEQRAVKIAFADQPVQHLLCHVHLKRTIDRKFKGKAFTQARKAIYSALFHRTSPESCGESLEEARRAIPRSHLDAAEKIRYIDNEIVPTLDLSANYNRLAPRPAILQQIKDTNFVENYHSVFKMDDKNQMASSFTFKGVVITTTQKDEQVTHRAEYVFRRSSRRYDSLREREGEENDLGILFRGLAYGAQKLIRQEVEYAEKLWRPTDYCDFDQVNMMCRCKFYTQYKILCRHMWRAHLESNRTLLQRRHYDSWKELVTNELGFAAYEHDQEEMEIGPQALEGTKVRREPVLYKDEYFLRILEHQADQQANYHALNHRLIADGIPRDSLPWHATMAKFAEHCLNPAGMTSTLKNFLTQAGVQRIDFEANPPPSSPPKSQGWKSGKSKVKNKSKSKAKRMICDVCSEDKPVDMSKNDGKTCTVCFRKRHVQSALAASRPAKRRKQEAVDAHIPLTQVDSNIQLIEQSEASQIQAYLPAPATWPSMGYVETEQQLPTPASLLTDRLHGHFQRFDEQHGDLHPFIQQQHGPLEHHQYYHGQLQRSQQQWFEQYTASQGRFS